VPDAAARSARPDAAAEDWRKHRDALQRVRIRQPVGPALL